MKERKYDFFISHASEDKQSFVRPLADSLSELGYKVWYDEFTLKLGDSLTKNISEGIKNSDYGIVILSKNFFSKKWANKELESLINKEVFDSDNIILPLWLDVSPQEVYEFYPLLIDKVAVKVSSSELDKAIKEIIRKKPIETLNTSKGQIKEKVALILSYSHDRRNKYYLDLEKRLKSIFLYQDEYYNWYTDEKTFPKNSWNDITVDLKGKELQMDYGIPVGVWIVPEPFPWQIIDRALKLCSKWIFREFTYADFVELYYVLEEELDTDVSYILFGFPHSTINGEEVRAELIEAIKEVGIQSPKNRVVSAKEYDRISSRVIGKYFGG